MCNPPILPPSFSSSSSLSSPSSSPSLYSNAYFYAKRIVDGGSYRPTTDPGQTQYSPSSLFFLGDDDDGGEMKEEDPHSPDSCFHCKTHLYANDDVYMYRGDISFCSEECRQDQMDIDEANEKRKNKLNMSRKKLKSMIEKNSCNSEEIRARVDGAAIAGYMETQ